MPANTMKQQSHFSSTMDALLRHSHIVLTLRSVQRVVPGPFPAEAPVQKPPRPAGGVRVNIGQVHTGLTLFSCPF